MLVVDSSVLVAHLRGDKGVTRFLRAYGGRGPLLVPALAAWELWRGATTRQRTESVRRLLDAVQVDSFTPAIARLAGDLDVHHRASGRQRPSIDLLIASHALFHQCPIATLDRDYHGVAGLSVVEAPGT